MRVSIIAGITSIFLISGLALADDLQVVLKSNDPSELIPHQGTPVPLGSLRNGLSQAAAPKISDNGDIVTQAWVANLALSTPDQRKIIVRVRNNGTKEVLARSGVPFPLSTAQTLPLITTFDDLRLSAEGSVAFNATLTGAGVNTTNDKAWFIIHGASEPARLLGRESDPIVGLTSPIGSFAKILGAPSSTAAPFSALVRATMTPQMALLQTSQNGSVTQIFRDLESVDDTGAYISSSGGTYSESNSLGEHVFVTSVLGSTVPGNNGSALWSYQAGVRRLLIRTGSAVPGGIAGVSSTIVFLHKSEFTGPRINDSGDILFAALTQMAGGVAPNGGGLFLVNANGSGFETIAASGSDRGFPSGTTIAAGDIAAGCIVSPSIDTSRNFFLSDSGTVFFKGVLLNCALSSQAGLFSSTRTSQGARVIRSILINGISLSGDSLARPVVVSASSPTTLWSSGDSITAWVQLIDGGNNSNTLVRYHAGTATPIVRNGSEIPWTFRHGSTERHILSSGEPAPVCTMNTLGQMLCIASLYNVDSGALNNWGLFTVNQRGDVRLAAVSGETMALSNGSSWPVGLLTWGGEALNNHGEFVFRTNIGALGWSDVLIKGTISETQQCIGDFDDNGAVTNEDLFTYLDSFFAQNPTADINHSGAVTVDDLIVYLEAYVSGC